MINEGFSDQSSGAVVSRVNSVKMSRVGVEFLKKKLVFG